MFFVCLDVFIFWGDVVSVGVRCGFLVCLCLFVILVCIVFVCVMLFCCWGLCV